MQNILILGSGGREHALTWKLKQSKQCGQIFVAPGNGGTQQLAQNLEVSPMDFDQVKQAIIKHKIDMLVVGPELPLVNGIYDYLSDMDNLKIIGPAKNGAHLEGSKSFANDFMEEFGIPTAASKLFKQNELENALSYLDQKEGPYVLKADGLAAGKGVLIIESRDEAKEEITAMLKGKFGDASSQVVIEEFLDGIEFSVFVLTDGKDYQMLPIAKDYKRIGEGDKGLNTGGMGAISPVAFVDQTLLDKVEKTIVQPTIKGIQARGMNYKGFVFIGLIKVDNEPYVIEYNVRLGDPETEVVLPRLENDLLELFNAVHDGNLSSQKISISDKAAATVMLVSGGYPESYQKNKAIHFDELLEGSIVFQAGTKLKDHQLYTNGGRVIAVTSMSDDFNTAVSTSIQNCEKIHFDKKYFRKDIGFDL